MNPVAEVDHITIDGSDEGEIFRFEPIVGQSNHNSIGWQGATSGATNRLIDAEKLTINGSGSADSFQVFPSATMSVHVHGDDPTTSPGDSLQIEPQTSSFLHAIVSRIFTVTGKQAVSYEGIEKLTIGDNVAFLANDANQDGFVDVTDIDFLFASINDGSTDPRFDFDQDGVVTTDDANLMIRQGIGTQIGDAKPRWQCGL